MALFNVILVSAPVQRIFFGPGQDLRAVRTGDWDLG